MGYTKFKKAFICFAMSIMIAGCCVLQSQAAEESEKTETNDDLDTHVDDGVPGILEEDDFNSPEDYKKYLEEHPERQVQTYSAQATANHEDEAGATLRYRIKGLKSGTAIQKTYIGSTYIYVIQRSGQNSYLSRCTINGGIANYKDRMLLKNFGHGQTLEWFEHKNKPYFWVTCKANLAFPDRYWGTQIGRIEYKANQTIDYTSICRFSHLSYANKKGTSIGSVKRVDAALSSDKSKIIFWVQDTTGEIQYSYYNTAKLNAELDKKEATSSKYVPCTNSAIKSACYGSFRQSEGNRVLPNGSCQGLEFSDAASIYVIGGGAGKKPKIAKMTGSGSSYKYSYLITAKHDNFGNKTESEGIQLKGNYVYFGIHDDSKNASKGEKECIYSIKKSAF